MTDPQFDADKNLLVLGGRRIVFHCHHYNVFLQRSIEDMYGEGADLMQIRAAAEAARAMLEPLLASAGDSWSERMAVAARVYETNGFGKADLSGLDPHEGGTIKLVTSHYALGWRAKWGASKAPVCHFATGFWRGAVAAAAGLAPERVAAREVSCAAVNDGNCEIQVEVR